MLKRSGIILIILLSFQAQTEIIIPDDVRDQIVEDVISENGYYDYTEIELRLREWKLEQEQPRSSGELTESGNCGSSCNQSGGDSAFPKPRNVKFKGKLVEESYTQNLIIKWKRPQSLPDDSLYQLKRYKVILSRDGETFEKYKVKAKYKNNGKPKKHQKLKLRGLDEGNYDVQVRAIYKLISEEKASHTKAASNSTNSSNISSEWTDQGSANVKKGDDTVGDFQSGSPILYACLTSPPYNFPDTKEIDTITSLSCPGNPPDNLLSDSDLYYINYFSGLTYLNLRDNPGITNLSSLTNLNLLEHLTLIRNNLNFNNYPNQLLGFDSLETLILKEQDLELIPAFPDNVDYINLDNNAVVDNAGGFFPQHKMDTIAISLNKEEYPDGNHLNWTTSNDFFSNLSSNNVEVRNLTARFTKLDDLSLVASIEGVEYLDLGYSLYLKNQQNLNDFGGLCGLNLEYSWLTHLNTIRPIQNLSLKGTWLLQSADVIDLAQDYWPHSIDYSARSGTACSVNDARVEKNATSSPTRLNDINAAFPLIVNGESVKPPNCPNVRTPSTFISTEQCKPDAPINSQVYEDVNSSNRIITWEMDSNHDFQSWGITHYKITAKDGAEIIDTFSIDASVLHSRLTTYSLQPDRYIIQACTEHQCGFSSVVTEGSGFQTGLARPIDALGIWDTSNAEDYKFKFKFKYPESSFNGLGIPDKFIISPNFGLPGTFTPVEILVSGTNGNCSDTSGENPCDGDSSWWYSPFIPESSFIGRDFSIKACNEQLGCGTALNVSLSTPLTSNDIERPVWASGLNQTIETGSEIVLDWDDSIFIDNNVNYIEVSEMQPVRNIFSSISDDPINYHTTRYYFENGSEAILNRLVKGTYVFTIKACSRNRESGDVCSVESQPFVVDLNRAEVTPQSVLPPNNIGFINLSIYDEEEPPNVVNKNPVAWEETSSKPDYYIMNIPNFGANCAVDNGTTKRPIENASNNQVSVITPSGDVNMLSTYGICPDLRIGEEVKIQSCFNGVGCGAPSQTFVHESPFQIIGSASISRNLGRSNVVGGPGDMKPGVWWNPMLSGTGWHFYWASELRYPSIRESYGQTYDLIGVWLTYQLINNEWSPTWMISHLKSVQNTTNLENCQDDDNMYSFNCMQYFEGELTYVEKDGTTLNRERVGTIQVYFDEDAGSDSNTSVILKMDIDANNGLLSQEGPLSDIMGTNCDHPGTPDLNDCMWVDLNGNINMPLTNYDESILGNPAAGNTDNDINHYSGMWSPVDNNGNIDTSYTYMVDIFHNLEWSALLMFDNLGRPLWALSDTCEDNPNCLETGEEEFTPVYKTIKRGFDPLHYTPNDFWTKVDNLAYGGIGSRTFNDGDTPEFNKMEFSASLNFNLPGGPSMSPRLASINTGQDILAKQASFHDIRFFINDSPENELICDPNQELNGQCNIRFAWFTDDDFPGIKPFYRKNQGTLLPLEDLCGLVVSNNTYVETSYECDINEPGDFVFELRKPSYLLGNDQLPEEWIQIAKTDTLVILPCTTENCESNNYTPLPEPRVVAVDPLLSGSVTSDISHMPGSGPVPGKAGVSGGAATYNIPINIPTGRLGVAPSLSINYSSKSGIGNLGMGWSLSAGSSIYRCPATIAQDGAFHAVDLSNEDRLCLDGQKLKRIVTVTNTGAYLAANSEYRTEIDSFSKVVYDGTEFTVYTKSGRIRTYRSVNNDPFSWQIKKEEDSFGNSIIYEYTQYGENENLLTDIWYTGEGDIKGNRHIEFNYESYEYGISYQAGLAKENTMRLSSLKTYMTQLIREYSFSFNPSNANNTFLLSEVNETAYDENGLNPVSRPLTEFLQWTDQTWDQNGENFNHFDYKDISTSPGASISQAVSSELLNRAQLKADYNGDGIKEFMVTSRDQEKRRLLFFNSNNQIIASLGLNGTLGYRFANVEGNADFNVDGITDLMVITKGYNNTCVDDRENALKIFTWKNSIKLDEKSFVEGNIEDYFDGIDYCGTLDLDKFDSEDTTHDFDLDIEKSKFFITDYNRDGMPDFILLRTPFVALASEVCYHFDPDCDVHSHLVAYKNTTNRNSVNQLNSENLSFTKQPGNPLANVIAYGDREPEDEVLVVIFDSIDSIDDFNGDGLPDFQVRTWYKVSVTEESHAQHAVRNDRILFSSLASDGTLSLDYRNLRSLGLNNFMCTKTDLSEEPCYLDSDSFSHIHGYKFTDVNGDGLKDYLYYDKGVEYLRNWKVRLNQGGDLNNLFAGNSISSTVNSTANLAFLDQGDECETINENSPDELHRMCNAYFRMGADFVDLNGDGINEFVFPEPDPAAAFDSAQNDYMAENLPFNYCGQFQNNTTHYFDFSMLEYLVAPGLYNIGLNTINIPYVPDGVEDIIHDLGEFVPEINTWHHYFRQSVFPNQPPQINGNGGTQTFTACSYSHLSNKQTGNQDIYRDFGPASATYDHGVYPYKAIQFEINQTWEGDHYEPALNLTLVNRTGIYKPLFSGTIGDINGDGLVDAFSSMGCVQSADNYCRNNSITNADAIAGGSPLGGSPWDAFISKLKVEGGVPLATFNNAHSPNLLTSIQKPVTEEIFEWDYHPISENLNRSGFPLYILPERGNGNEDGYINQTDSHGEYFYFNSSMFVVSEMRASTGIFNGGSNVFSKTQYAYEEAVYNNLGRGFQGFRNIKVKHTPYTGSDFNQTLSESKFHQIFPLAGQLESIDVKSNNQLVSFTKYEYDQANQSQHSSYGVFFNPTSEVIVSSFEPTTGEIYSLKHNTFDSDHADCDLYNQAYDNFGNVLCQQSSLTSYTRLGAVETHTTVQESATQNSYYLAETGTDQWWVNKLKNTEKTTRISEFGDLGLPADYNSSLLTRFNKSTLFWGIGDERELVCTFVTSDGTFEPTGCVDVAPDTDTIKTFNVYDGYGQIESTTQSGQTLGGSQTMVNQNRSTGLLYDNDCYFKTDTTKYLDDGSVLAKETNFDCKTGQVKQDIQLGEQNNPNDDITTDFVYDNFGFLTEQSTHINSDLLAQPSFTSQKNCLGGQCAAAESIISNAMTGIKQTIESDNPIAFDFSGSTSFYYRNNEIHLPRLVQAVETVQEGSNKTTQWYNQYGQVVLTENESSGGTSYVLSLTNPMGHTELVTQPFLAGTSPYFKYDMFDDHGRVNESYVKVGDLTGAGGNCWRYTIYDHNQGLTEITAAYTSGNHCDDSAQNILGMSRAYDASGNLRYTKDARNYESKYWYDSTSNPSVVMDDDNNEIVTTYDNLGRKVAVKDPNMGIKTFAYNSFGEVIFEQNASQAEFELNQGLTTNTVGNYTMYDNLGRSTQKYWNVDVNLAPLADLRSYKDSFNYQGCGSPANLCFEYRYTNFQDDALFTEAQYKSYEYDGFNRVRKENIEITDVFGGLAPTFYDSEFSIEYHYYVDHNLLKQTTYHKSDIRGFDDSRTSFYSVLNYYDVYGKLQKQQRVMESINDDETLLDNITYDFNGLMTSKRLNNRYISDYSYHPGTKQMKNISHWVSSGNEQMFNYKYDAWGNIKEQTLHDMGGLIATELFDYDKLQRLTSAVMGNINSTTNTISYGYDNLGNLTSKSDYSDNQQYGFGPDRKIQPNAISSAALINAGGTINYDYDARGNRVADTGAVNNAYSYDANNLLYHASKDADSEVHFRYGVDHQRYLRFEDSLDLDDPTRSQEASIYAGAYFEEVIDLSTLKRETKVQISDYLTITVNDNQRIDHHFMHKDHLGSTTQIIDGFDNIIKTMSYDAFGKPRNGDNWDFADPAQLDFNSDGSIDITKRGFTDHEHVDNFELIHMNGRMYDFNNGRFLSVDPFIQGMTSQAINPYSYIQNNPLSGTDPTGYRIWRLPKDLKAIGEFIGVFASEIIHKDLHSRRRVEKLRLANEEALRLGKDIAIPLPPQPGFEPSDGEGPAVLPNPIQDPVDSSESLPMADPIGPNHTGNPESYNGAENFPIIMTSEISDFNGQNTKPIHDGKQGKHQPGHNNYDESKNRSIFTHPDPQGLVDKYSGTGEQVGDSPVGEPGSKERVNFEEVIGLYVDPNTGEKIPTTAGTVHHSKSDVHIVPARPIEESNDE